LKGFISFYIKGVLLTKFCTNPLNIRKAS